MSPLARTNRHPDSLPVVLRILEGHPGGLTIRELGAEVTSRLLWGPLEARPLYQRVYGVLQLLRRKGLVRRVGPSGREDLWALDPEAAARRRRQEIFDMVRPFVDGCLTISDPRQLLGELGGVVEDGTLDALLAERRARRRAGTQGR